MANIQLTLKGRPVVIIKAFVAKEKTPKFVGNNPGVNLQGDDIQLTVDDLRKWRAVKDDIKGELADKIVTDAENKFAKKKGLPEGSTPFKGRDLIIRTLEESVDFGAEEKVDVEIEELIDIESKEIDFLLEQVPEKRRDVVLEEAMRRSLDIGHIAEHIPPSAEKVDHLIDAIEDKWSFKPVMSHPKTGLPMSVADLGKVLNKKRFGAIWFEIEE